MSEEIKNMEAKEESFEELLDKSFKTLNTGEKVTGIVTAITPTEVQVDLGCKAGRLYFQLSELTDDPSVKPEDVVKVGDEIETYIVRVNDVEGYADAVQEASGCREGLGEHRRGRARTRPLLRARSPRRTRAASSSTSRACVCSFPLLRAASPVAPI